MLWFVAGARHQTLKKGIFLPMGTKRVKLYKMICLSHDLSLLEGFDQ